MLKQFSSIVRAVSNTSLLIFFPPKKKGTLFNAHANPFICGIQVYQEKALKDKERYRAEMEYYREKQRTGQVISNAVPLQQLPPEPSTDTAEVEDKTEAEGGNSEHTMETDSVDSSDRDLSNDDTANDDFEIERSSREDGNVMVEEEGFKLRKGAEEDVGECSQNSIDVEMRVEKESVQEGDH